MKIVFANQNDEEELKEILWEYQMDLCGNIEEHLVIKDQDEVVAGSKIIEHEDSRFFIILLGVKKVYQNLGLGSLLLSKIIANPWSYCKETRTSFLSQKNIEITTIARGESADFYRRYGFIPCEFSNMPIMFREQCEQCPDIEECNPVPMILMEVKQ